MHFKPIHLPHLSTNANAVFMALAVSHSCPDLIYFAIAFYCWSTFAQVVGK
tara:strand:+ start:1888 stop:2040 length:153 start_codon:yes stop_codon:yes gene_type:complete